MKVLILTEGGAELGLGHIIRCSSIYQCFSRHTSDIKFIINGDSSVYNILEGYDYFIYDWINNPLKIEENTIVLIDSYIASKELYEKISKKASVLIILDDNNRLDYPKSVVVNGTVLANKFNYQNNDEVTYLLGSEYIPLREDFHNSDMLKINEKVQSVLITMGGSDLRDLTPKLLDLLPKNLKKVVIIGNSFKNKDKFTSDENTIFIINPDGKAMKEAMLNVDLAISASGQTLYELARLGIPTIAIGIIENQINNIKNWLEVGFIEFAGFWDDINLDKNILNKLNLLCDYDIRLEKHHLGLSTVDGKGSLRIVKFALNRFFKENTIFREIKREDCFKIYEIANDDLVRLNSFNTDKIQLNEHKIWFDNILKNNNIKFFILEYEKEIIGQVRFDFDEDFPVISISLNPKFRGLGLATFLLEKSINEIDAEKIVAYIKKTNIKSIKLFENFNFKLENEVIIKNNEALMFVRCNNDY